MARHSRFVPLWIVHFLQNVMIAFIFTSSMFNPPRGVNAAPVVGVPRAIVDGGDGAGGLFSLPFAGDDWFSVWARRLMVGATVFIVTLSLTFLCAKHNKEPTPPPKVPWTTTWQHSPAAPLSPSPDDSITSGDALHFPEDDWSRPGGGYHTSGGRCGGGAV